MENLLVLFPFGGPNIGLFSPFINIIELSLLLLFWLFASLPGTANPPAPSPEFWNRGVVGDCSIAGRVSYIGSYEGVSGGGNAGVVGGGGNAGVAGGGNAGVAGRGIICGGRAVRGVRGSEMPGVGGGGR